MHPAAPPVEWGFFHEENVIFNNLKNIAVEVLNKEETITCRIFVNITENFRFLRFDSVVCGIDIEGFYFGENPCLNQHSKNGLIQCYQIDI